MKHPLVFLDRSTSIQKSIQLIERSPYDRAFVVDETGSYLGTTAIADLRRLLISGARGEEEIGVYPLKHSYKLTEPTLTNRRKADRLISDMQLYGIRFIPVIAPGGKIREVLSIEDIGRLHGVSGINSAYSVQPAHVPEGEHFVDFNSRCDDRQKTDAVQLHIGDYPVGFLPAVEKCLGSLV